MSLKTLAKLAAIAATLLLLVSCGGGGSNFVPTPITSAIVITTSTLPEAESGSSYAAKFQAQGGTGVYEWKVASGILPEGVSLLSDGTLSGSPADEGDYSFAVRASDTSNPPQSASKDYNVKVKGARFKITTASVPVGKVGSPYSATLAASGGTTPYTWSIASGTLPSSMTLGATTGVISGTPSSSGTFSFTAQAQDSKSQKATSTLTLSVNSQTPPPVEITTIALPGTTVGESYSATVEAAGGVAPYTWSIGSGSLPAGLALNGSNGNISGTSSEAGTFDITLAIQDSTGASATKRFSITVAAALVALQITTGSLPGGTIESPYSATLAATGGTPPYTWSIVSGALPSSMSLAATTGVISGTPSAGGDFNFTVQVQDAASTTAASNFTLPVSPTALDQYGGATNVKCASASGYFHTEKIGDRWWLCTPEGNGFFQQGVFLVDPENRTDPWGRNLYSLVTTKYGGLATWGWRTAQRLKSWGFNTIETASSAYIMPYAEDSSYPVDAYGKHTNPAKLPYRSLLKPTFYAMTNPVFATTEWYDMSYLIEPVKNFEYGWAPRYTGWRTAAIADYYDDNLFFMLNQILTRDRAWQKVQSGPYKKWLIGVAIDDGDQMFGFGAGPDFATSFDHVNPHLALMVATMSPLLTAAKGPSGGYLYYTDSAVRIKQKLRDVLTTKYGSIAALNTAWGSNYSTFDSTGTIISGEAFGYPNGSTATFSHNLASIVPSRFSITLKVNGTAIAGEVQSDSGPRDTDHGKIWGPNVAGTITHSTGAMSVTFAPGKSFGVLQISSNGSVATIKTRTQHGFWTGAKVDITGTTSYNMTGQPVTVLDSYDFTIPLSSTFATERTGTVTLAALPQAGDTLTVDYVQNGWGLGTGLMDEDGRNKWIPVTEPVVYTLAGFNPSIKADLDAFLEEIADHYFSNCRSQLKAVSPDLLYLGPDSLGTWDMPSRPQVLAAAGRSLDAQIVGDSPEPYSQAIMDFIYSNFGDKPLMGGVYLTANADSPEWGWARDAAADMQEEKGQKYLNAVSTIRSQKYSANNSHPYIGFGVWAYRDMWNEKANWGLITYGDNAYDGHEAVTATGPCSPPLEAYTCGGEPAYPTWQASHAYQPPNRDTSGSAGDRIQVNVNNTHYVFEAVKTGTSGSTQPSWPTTKDATVLDGGVTWKNDGIKTNPNGFGDVLTQVKQANALFYNSQ